MLWHKLYRKGLSKTKYLAIETYENLNWKMHAYDLASELNRAKAVLAKHFVNSEILRSTYLAIFHSHLNYACLAWKLKIVSILQKKH